MRDLRQVISDLSQKKVTRKEFLIGVGGSFLGMLGIFRLFEVMNLPEGDDSDPAEQELAFGEKEYGGAFIGSDVRDKKDEDFS